MNRSPILRIVAALLLLVLWEAAARSGLFYRGVLPSALAIASALFRLASDPGFWRNVGVTVFEVVCAVLIGGTLGVFCGIAVGGVRLLRRAFTSRRCTIWRRRRRSFSCRS